MNGPSERRGMTATLPNSRGTYLNTVLQVVPLQDYYWLIEPHESYFAKNGEWSFPLFPERRILTGEELLTLIRQPAYLIFADIKAFKGTIAKNITTYDQFTVSDCELAIFITDSVHLELYCKKPILLDELIQNATDCHLDDIDVITNENDGRTTFSID